MKFKAAWFVVPIWLCANSMWVADNTTVDSVTKLPVPAPGESFSLYDRPMLLDDFAVCKSTAKISRVRLRIE